MLTESQARGLLLEAAGTIEVAPAGPFDETGSRRPRWPVLAAAAAAVLAVAGGLALAPAGNDEPAPTRPPEKASAVPSPPLATLAPCGPNDVCEMGVIVPSVLGLQEEEAREWLDSAGQEVRTVYVDRDGCQPDGMVLDQQPRPGTSSPVGATVRLTVNRNADDFCGGLPGPG